MFKRIEDATAYWLYREDGSFEEWSGGAPTGWDGVKTSGVFSQYSDDAYDGDHSVQLRKTSSSHVRFTSQNIRPARFELLQIVDREVGVSVHVVVSSAALEDLDGMPAGRGQAAVR